VTETAPDLVLSPTPSAPSWSEALDQLRQRFPEATDGILFCAHKLQQNPNLGLRDLRAEAGVLGLSLAGRSLHSARVLLGLAGRTAAEKAPSRRGRTPQRGPRPEPKARVARRTASPPRVADADAPVETRLLSAVRQLQEAAASESQKLRRAIAAAIRVLQEALQS
jgi:hypothetical protein